MLVLNRKVGEAISLELPSGVERKVIIQIVEVKGSYVRLGISGDTSVVVNILSEDDLRI